MREFPKDFNIAAYFLDDRIDEGRGSRTAIFYKNEKITYSGVQVLANKFANVLRELGVEQENRVLIALPDSPEYAGALFGILKLGAVVVMVNPHLRDDEVEYFLEYSRAKAAVVHASALDKFKTRARNLLVVGDKDCAFPSWEQRRDWAPPEFKNARTHRDDAAIWLFSGGTTGRPKAVIQTHQSFANTTELYAKKCIGYNENDITISVPKLFFGYATGSNLFFPFSVGAAAALFDERCTPEVLVENIREYRPTILINVPTMINQLLQSGATAEDFASLRLTTSAGEALPVELYKRWKERFKVEILDGLGTAEMWHIFISNRLGDVKPGSLGRIVDGFEAKICDESGAELPDGETGCLWIRGQSRAIAYVQDIEKTARAFVGDWYVSGDLLRRDAQGYYYYEGRADDMMKVAGKWASPQEIENCLLKHSAVKECAVVPFTDSDGLVKPKAFVVLKNGGGASESELQEFVKSNTAQYKCPRKIAFMESLPRTHLGKIDRNNLRRL